jgi:hypothetical protein
MFGERTRLGCWFESLAVAWRPLQRRPRRNILNHELASGRRGDLATPNLFASHEF